MNQSVPLCLLQWTKLLTKCKIFKFKLSDERYKPISPEKGFLKDLSAAKNLQPLPPIRQNFGLRLPNDRFCQVQPNYAFSPTSSDSLSPQNPQHNDESDTLQRARQTDIESSAPNPVPAKAPINMFNAESVSKLLGKRPASDPLDDDYD